MMQREISHPRGSFALCRCGAEPRHVEAHGTTSRERTDAAHPVDTRHGLECGCGARTAWLPTLANAVAAWNAQIVVPEVPEPSNVRTLHWPNRGAIT